MKSICIILALLFLSGCAVRTIYVQEGEAVMLRETIKKAKVWIKAENGDKIPGSMPLQEGWFVMSLSDDELREMGLEDLIELRNPQNN